MSIEEQIKHFIEKEDYVNCISFLIENTGKNKPINPENTTEMEKYYSILFIHLNIQENYRVLHKSAFRLLHNLEKLEREDNHHYHKGLMLHNLGIASYKYARDWFIYAFIEDVIREKIDLPFQAATQHLQGLFKADIEDLSKLGKYTLKYQKNLISNEEILSHFLKDRIELFMELWRIEYNISQIEKEIRDCLNSVLPNGWIDDKTIFSEKPNLEGNREREIELLGRASSDSLVDYMSFSHYTKIIKIGGEKYFKQKIKDIDEFNNKLMTLEYLRNKIAHFRKVFPQDIKILKEVRLWLAPKISVCLNVKQGDLQSQIWDSRAVMCSGMVYH